MVNGNSRPNLDAYRHFSFIDNNFLSKIALKMESNELRVLSEVSIWGGAFLQIRPQHFAG